MARTLDELRKAIEACGVNRHRIAQDTGISASALSRWFSGERGLSIESIETLVDYLGMEIIIKPKRQRKRG
jgi:transcriptional regulator with XRE-family HTH domain